MDGRAVCGAGRACAHVAVQISAPAAPAARASRQDRPGGPTRVCGVRKVELKTVPRYHARTTLVSLNTTLSRTPDGGRRANKSGYSY